MQQSRVLVGVLIALLAVAAAPYSTEAQSVPGCPLIPIPDAASIADPDRERFPYPPPAPLRITGIERTHVQNMVSIGSLGELDASYCLYSPPSLTPQKGLVLYNHGFQFGETGALDAM